MEALKAETWAQEKKKKREMSDCEQQHLTAWNTDCWFFFQPLKDILAVI